MKKIIPVLLIFFSSLSAQQKTPADIYSVGQIMDMTVNVAGWNGKGNLIDYAWNKIQYFNFNGCEGGTQGCWDRAVVILGVNDTALFALEFAEVPDDDMYSTELICAAPGKEVLRENIFTRFYSDYSDSPDIKKIRVPALKKSVYKSLDSLFKKYKLNNLKTASFEANTNEVVSWVAKVYWPKLKTEFTWYNDVNIVCEAGFGEPGPDGWRLVAEPLVFPKLFSFGGFRINLPQEMKAITVSEKKKILVIGKDSLTIYFDDAPADLLKFRKLEPKKENEYGSMFLLELYYRSDYNDSLANAAKIGTEQDSGTLEGIGHLVYFFAPKQNADGKICAYIITTTQIIILETKKLPADKIDLYWQMFSTIRKVN